MGFFGKKRVEWVRNPALDTPRDEVQVRYQRRGAPGPNDIIVVTDSSGNNEMDLTRHIQETVGTDVEITHIITRKRGNAR